MEKRLKKIRFINLKMESLRKLRRNKMKKKLPLNAKKIKMFRIANGLTVIELAKRIKKTRATIYNYENGTQMPTPKTLQKIAGVLGVSPMDLIGE